MTFVKGQTLYWIGGSGNFNDRQHWSLTSGGQSANVVPTSNHDLVFNNNSSSSFNQVVINFVGLNHAQSIKCENTDFELHFIGNSFSNLRCNGSFELNAKTFFQANTKLIFSNTSSSHQIVNFFGNIINADVLFEAGNWNLQFIKLADNNTLKLNQGNYQLTNTSIVSGNLDASAQAVSFNVYHSTIHVKNKLSLGENVRFSSNELIIIANKNTPSLYQISSNANLGNSYKIIAPNPQACAISYSFTNPTCNGVCNASMQINFDAGCTTGPYNLIFNTAATCLPGGINGIMPPVLLLPNLCSCQGNQLDIFVFDINGFVASQTNLNMPANPTPINMNFFAARQPNCFGQCNGAVNISLTGGASPYNVFVNPPSGTNFTINAITTNTVNGLCAGVQTFSVNDNNNCARTFTTLITQPATLIPNGVSSSVTCNGVCNGDAAVSPTGGTSPYTYIWSASAASSTNSVVSNLCAGPVTATVTDTRSCVTTFSASITQPPPITLTVNRTNLICGALCDGTATITAAGGSGAGYSYTWTPNVSSSSSANGLCAGDYTVNVSDNLNCIRTVTFNITAPPTLTATTTQTNVLCNGSCTGISSITASGGTGTYSYNWSAPIVTTSSVAINLCQGVYSFTVTDAVNCTFVNTVTITQPPPTTLTIAPTNVTCFGSCNGQAIATALGGTGAYTFSWSPGNPTGQGTNSVSNLCPNSYTLIVRDANSCLTVNSTTITQPTDVVINPTSTLPTCNGLCNGSIGANPTGGTSPYTFTLQPSVGPQQTGAVPFNGLCAGSYTLTIRDALGCTRTQTLNLTQPNPVTLALNTTSISCFNQCNATIATVVGGGTPAYTFTWSVGGTASSLSNQCSGVYSASVTDAAGCSATASVNITAPPQITVSIVPTNPNCQSQCTGIATATASGGTPNYTYNWNNGVTSNINSNLCDGTYTLTVQDFRGCAQTQTVSIIAPPAITLTPVNATVSCAASCDGTISVNPSGGTPGFVYSWNTVPTRTTQTITNLCPGNYIATVTDSRGCVANSVVNIAQPPILTASVTNIQSSCNVCIGGATGLGIGGTAPYTYSWSAGQTTQIVNDLCVGVQTLTVRDAGGCVATTTVFIDQTVLILLTSNGNTLACNGNCSGIANANASGGTGPGTYSFSWTPSNQSTQTATNLCAGGHTVLVVDGNGCSNTDVVNFQNPPAITLTVNQTNINCHGACNGSASALATGGTGPISYLWQPGNITNPSISSLCPGNYTITASDGNNCSQTQVVTITETNSLTATFNSTNPSSCVINDGSISFIPSGGLPPYSFTWTPGGSVNPLVNLADGTYVLNLRDNNGCIRSFTTTLSDPLGPTVTVTSNSINCFGLCTGSASLSITASTPGFTVNWPTIPSNSQTVTGLCVGNYVAQVTDANGCSTNQSVNITQPSQITNSGISSNVTCNTGCNGSISLTPAGGSPPYSYTWSPSGGNVEDPVNLCSGNYSVTVRDNNNCIVTNMFSITQPLPLAINFNKRDVRCNGGCTGGVRAIVSGGQTPYSYSWTPQGSFAGSVVDTIGNLCTGIYSVSVRDANNCLITATVSILEPSVLTSTVISNNILCNGQCNGTATLTASGGTLPYSFSYNSSPSINTFTANTLCSGSYLGTVTDGNGCISSRSFTITQPLPIVITTTVTNPLCNAACNGSITTTVFGGTAGYTFSWATSGGNVQNPTGLCAGNYTLTVTDANSCNRFAVANLVNPPALIANTTFTNPVCGITCNGAIRATPIGGTAPYSYSWSNSATTQQINGVCAGNYSVTVTDNTSCTSTQVVNLISPSTVSVNPAVTPAGCGFSNGSISAVPFGGDAPYTFTWLAPVPPAQSTNTTVTGLAAGVYTLLVSDASLCSATVTIPLSNSSGPNAASITSTNVACNGQCNGAATVSSPVGGTGPYILSWVNPVSASTTVSGLCTGSYTAQIRDGNNCIFFQSVSITEPQLIDDNEILTSASCFGNCNGSILLNPFGGNGGYTYAWNDGTNLSSISNVCPGNYSVTITDSRNCTFSANYNLPSLVSITSSTMITDNICFNNCNGTALATSLAGGLPPYSFNWSDPLGQSTPQAVGLCNGSYSVIITDANGCSNVILADITSPTPVNFTQNVTQPSCNACDGLISVTPSGGTPGYTFLWSNGQTGTTVNNLCAGVYDIEIRDLNGCLTNTNVIINSISGFTGETVTKMDVTCSSVCDGTVSVTAIGGQAPIVYQWVHDNSSSQTLTGLCPGTYFCNITDANGCSRTVSVTINSLATLTVSSLVTQSNCSLSTGSITVNVLGGVGPYVYNWLPLGTGSTATVTSLASGLYTLTVNDANGCAQSQNYALGSISGPVITSNQNNSSCSVACDGNISINITGGNPGYTVLWSNAANTNTINNLCAGNYSVSVTDALGCRAFQNFSVTNSPPIVFNLPNSSQPACFNDCNGSITALPIGGSLPYTYNWLPSGPLAPFNDLLCAGNYTFIVTDANGCNASQTYTLVNPTAIAISGILTQASCNNTADAAIDLSVNGGTPSYVYNWSNASVTEDLTAILPGTYTVSVADAKGCQKDSVFIITPAVIVNAIAGSDTSFCENGTLLLNGSNSSNGLTYQWLELPSNTVVSNTTVASVTPAIGTTTYVLLAQNGLCFDSDTVFVTANPLPSVDAGPFLSVPLFSTVQIGGSPTAPSGSSITWLPNFSLDDSNASNPTTTTTITTIYTVSVVDANGCRNSDTVTVYVFPEIVIPNGFSPNGDGKNDTWILDLIYLFPNCEIEVYNRWGEQLFYSKGYNTPFNGQFRGKDLPVGTYYYIINLNDVKYPKPYTGPLTIFR